MAPKLIDEYRARPSVACYMARAFVPSAGLAAGAAVPRFVARWRRVRIPRRHLQAFLSLTGLSEAGSALCLYPHVFGFPLLMALLTRPAYPLPIWNALQIRNALLLHRRISADEAFDLETRVAGQRVLEKGLEVDLHTVLAAGGSPAWESLVTLYYRGRFGSEDARSPLSQTPEFEGREVASWRMPARGGLRFGRLTGDYNGIHWSRAYARAFGFEAAFLHPQRVLGQCLARLRSPGDHSQRLDAWLKGPVYYGRAVGLRASGDGNCEHFALVPEGERRASIVGRLCAVPAGAGLLDAQGRPLPFTG